MSSGQEIENQLREQLRSALAQPLEDVEKELREVRTTVSTAMDALNRRLAGLRELDFDGVQAFSRDAVAEVEQRKASEARIVAEFGDDLPKRETQEEILSWLLDTAHRFAPTVALFVVRGESLCGWSSRGFSEVTAREISNSSFPASASPFLAGALVSRSWRTTADASQESRLLQIVRTEAETPWHALTLSVFGKPSAVLFATALAGSPCNEPMLRILVCLTQFWIENVALRLLSESRTRPAPARTEKPAEATTAVTPAAGEQQAAEPTAARAPAAADETAPAVEAEAESPQEDESSPGDSPEDREEDAASADVVSDAGSAAGETEEPAASLMESFPAAEDEDTVEPQSSSAPTTVSHFEEAADEEGFEVQEPFVAPQPPPPRIVPVESIAAKPQEAERIHSDAKRFARLLVSEIKLYNEQRVVEGRVHRDLYIRLKRDIDRSRDMYQKRVSPAVAHEVDYFHDELIRILGENDPSSLGSDYPGPHVES